MSKTRRMALIKRCKNSVVSPSLVGCRRFVLSFAFLLSFAVHFPEDFVFAVASSVRLAATNCLEGLLFLQLVLVHLEVEKCVAVLVSLHAPELFLREWSISVGFAQVLLKRGR